MFPWWFHILANESQFSKMGKSECQPTATMISHQGPENVMTSMLSDVVGNEERPVCLCLSVFSVWNDPLLRNPTHLRDAETWHPTHASKLLSVCVCFKFNSVCYWKRVEIGSLQQFVLWHSDWIPPRWRSKDMYLFLFLAQFALVVKRYTVVMLIAAFDSKLS